MVNTGLWRSVFTGMEVHARPPHLPCRGVLGLADEERYQDMESLLQDESLDFRTLRRGDVVEGHIISFYREGVLVDISSKSEGIIPLTEMHSLGADPISKLKVVELI